jgi:hypothetical protein
MPHLELIFLHSESADGCNARRVRTADVPTPDAEPRQHNCPRRVACIIAVVGYLDGGSHDTSRETAAGVGRGLSEAGYVEDRNVAIEYRWAEDHYDRLPGLADDLVGR